MYPKFTVIIVILVFLCSLLGFVFSKFIVRFIQYINDNIMMFILRMKYKNQLAISNNKEATLRSFDEYLKSLSVLSRMVYYDIELFFFSKDSTYRVVHLRKLKRHIKEFNDITKLFN